MQPIPHPNIPSNMLQVRYQYQGDLGEIKRSQAVENARFSSKTGGIALKYVRTGQEDYQVDQTSISLRTGQFMILEQGASFQAFTSPKKVVTQGICIDLDPKLIYALIPNFSDVRLLFGLPFQGQHSIKLSQQLLKMAQEDSLMGWHQQGRGLLRELGRSLQLLALEIVQYQAALAVTSKKLSTQKDILAKLLLANDLIHQHYRSKLSLDQLARQVGLSKYHLSRLFKHCFGQSPLALHQDLRMQEARRLLQEEHLTIAEIAFGLGYGDLAAFSSQFKKYYQAPPSRYRCEMLNPKH